MAILGSHISNPSANSFKISTYYLSHYRESASEEPTSMEPRHRHVEPKAKHLTQPKRPNESA